MKLQYTVVFDRGQDGYTATVPALPGLVTGGRSVEEARTLAIDAVRCHLESLLKDGEPLPLEQAVTVESLEVELLIA